jgi:L-threonylcarbamoyladenylate synthase
MCSAVSTGVSTCCSTAPGGLESTVVDLSGASPRILRPGLVSAEELSATLDADFSGVEVRATDKDAALPSPGMLRKHYSPTVPVFLTADDGATRVQELAAGGSRIGWIPLGPEIADAPDERIVSRSLPAEPKAYAASLYSTLHELEQCGVAAIVIERPPAGPAWAAVLDRLSRAAAE